MARYLVIALLLGACVAESEPPPVVTIHSDDPKQDAPTDTTAICNAAAALPAEDACSLVCDPDAFAARLSEDGMSGGTCYQIRCELAAEMTVTVGVCLP